MHTARLIAVLLTCLKTADRDLSLKEFDFSSNDVDVIDRQINDDALRWHGELKTNRPRFLNEKGDEIIESYTQILNYLNQHLCGIQTNLNVLYNLIQLAEGENNISKSSAQNLTLLWECLIKLHMGSPYKLVQTQSLKALESILKEAQSNDSISIVQNNVFQKILTNWSWTNSIKFTHLTLFYTVRPIYSEMSEQYEFDDNFLEGITFSLKYRHLYTAGKNLLRILNQVNPAVISDWIAHIFRNNSIFEVRNLIKYWLNDGVDLEEIFVLMRLNERFEILMQSENYIYLRENDFGKFVIFRKLFHKYFMGRSVIDDFVINRMNCEDLSMRTEVFEILILNQITSIKPKNRKNLELICMFLQNNSCTDCAAFRQSIFYNLKKLLQHFINKIATHLEDIDFFFKFLKDNVVSLWHYYQLGNDNYQNIIYAVTIYKIVMDNCVVEETAFSPNRYRVSVSPLAVNKKKMYDYLRKNHIFFYDDVKHFNYLINLIHSEHEDVREIAIELIASHFICGSDNLLYQSYDFLGKAKKYLANPSIKDCYTGPFFVVPFLNAAGAMDSDFNLNSFITEIVGILVVNFTEFQADPLLACKTGKHLFGYIQCLSKIFAMEKMDLPITFGEIINTIKEVCEKFLFFLNSANESNAPSFEIMYASLKIILKSSSVYDDEKIEEDYKYLLLSIWYTLEACSIFSFQIVRYMIKHNHHHENIDVIRNCIDINSTLLIKSCHKGVIEAAGEQLGKIVDLITRSYVLFDFCENDEKSLYTTLIEHLKNLTIEALHPKKLDYQSEMRSQRGLTIMFHALIKNDKTTEKQLFDSVKSEINKCDRVLTLHHLSGLMRDSELTEDMFKHINKLLYNMFLNDDNFQTADWNRRNASLQLFSAIIKRMINQQQFYADDDNKWDSEIHVLISFNIFTDTLRIFLDKITSLDKTVLVMFLELLSNCDADNFCENEDLLNECRTLYWNLFDNSDAKIRLLAAKCFTNSHNFYDEIPNMLPHLIPLLFNTSINENFVHSLILSLNFMIKKYIAHVRFVKPNFRKNKFLAELRSLLIECYENRCKNDNAIVFSYFVRCYLLDLLVYMGFKNEDVIYQNLILKPLAIKGFGFDYFQYKTDKQNVQEIYIELK